MSEDAGVLDYRHARSKRPWGRLAAALILTAAAGAVAGCAWGLRWTNPFRLTVVFPFACTLAMVGLLAGRRQAAVAIVACTAFSTTAASLPTPHATGSSRWSSVTRVFTR